MTRDIILAVRQGSLTHPVPVGCRCPPPCEVMESGVRVLRHVWDGRGSCRSLSKSLSKTKNRGSLLLCTGWDPFYWRKDKFSIFNLGGTSLWDADSLLRPCGDVLHCSLSSRDVQIELNLYHLTLWRKISVVPILPLVDQWNSVFWWGPCGLLIGSSKRRNPFITVGVFREVYVVEWLVTMTIPRRPEDGLDVGRIWVIMYTVLSRPTINFLSNWQTCTIRR